MTSLAPLSTNHGYVSTDASPSPILRWPPMSINVSRPRTKCSRWSDQRSTKTSLYCSLGTISSRDMTSQSSMSFNVYNRPARANAAVQSLLKILPTLPNVAIIQGDFNLHSPLWDAGIQRGSSATLHLYTEMSDLGLNLLNNEDEPTWTNGRGSESVLDLLFVSDHLCPLNPFIEMSMDNRGRSDHALISCLFGTQLLRPGTPYIAKDSEEEDELCFFIGSLLAAISDLGPNMDVEGTCKYVSNQISVKWNSLAKTPITSRPHGTSWWNNKCQAYRDVYNLTRTKENFKAYNTVTHKARTAFFEAKIAVMTAIKRPWEGVRWTRPRPPPPYSTIEVNGSAPSDVQELFGIMHEQFSKAATFSPSEDNVCSTLNQLDPMPARSFPRFSEQELCDALDLTGSNSAPGPDRITWELLKIALDINGAIKGLCHLFNRIRTTGTWPSWFKASILLANQSPKHDRKAPHQDHCHAYAIRLPQVHILHPGQCGGVAKHATIDTGVTLASFVAESRELGLHSMACAFDISQFFPSLSHVACALILRRFGFNESLIRILQSYFTGQTTRYKWDSATSHDYEFNIGTPQGDCISPILSAIYLGAGIRVALPLPFPPPNVRSLFFVDDGLLYCASRSLRQNTERIEKCLERVQSVLATLGLFIDADKTELIHFPGFDKNKKSRQLASLLLQPSIAIRSLGGEHGTVTIKPKPCIRYLGFYFDSELSWNAHVTFYLNRAFSTIRALCMLGSSIRGLGTLQKRHLYQACVILVLTYGLPLWFAHDGVGVKKFLLRINKVHSHACKWIVGCFRTTPIGAREVITGLPPLVLLLNSLLHGF
ncbi:hypothetical protein AX14_001185 [Amanita brunnescens Koide BX004]|nr:hypothetical protein AX14_001185 [Amanita brunnescens Koide BX004]